MLKGIGALLVLLLLVSAAPLLAHGGKTHIMGTVTEVDASHVVVKTREGRPVSILLDKDTKFRSGKADAKAAELKVGDRIVVDVTGKGDKQKATEVRLSGGGAHEGHEGMKDARKKP